MPTPNTIRTHLLLKVADGATIELDIDSLIDWLLSHTFKWREIALIPPSEARGAVQAAIHLSLIDAGRISPRGSQRAKGHFAAQDRFDCCTPAPGTKRRVDPAHGHRATLTHLCHVFSAAGCVSAAQELHLLLKRALVLYDWAGAVYDDHDLEDAVMRVVEDSWGRLLDARERGVKWTYGPAYAPACATLVARAMNATIDRQTPPEGEIEVRPVANPRRAARAQL